MFDIKSVVVAAAVFLAPVAASAATIISATLSTPTTEAGYSVNNAGTWVTEPSIVSGSVSGQYASPFDDASADYYTVGSPGLVQSPAILSVDPTTTFSMLWGTVDTYNSVVFSGAGGTEEVTGQDIITALGGVAVGGTNAIVDFTLDFEFTTVSFNSNFGVTSGADQAAFEFALATVPLPAAGLLLLTALGGAAALRRRKAMIAA